MAKKGHYDESKKWADGFHKAIIEDVNTLMARNKLLNYEIKIADLQADREEATDYKIEYGKDQAIAARVRGHEQAFFVEQGLLLRYKRPTMATTEYEKIIRGYGDYYLYCLGNKDGKSLDWSILIDLDAFRYALIDCPAIREEATTIRMPDGVTTIEFKWEALSKYGVVIDDVDRRSSKKMAA